MNQTTNSIAKFNCIKEKPKILVRNTQIETPSNWSHRLTLPPLPSFTSANVGY